MSKLFGMAWCVLILLHSHRQRTEKYTWSTWRLSVEILSAGNKAAAFEVQPGGQRLLIPIGVRSQGVGSEQVLCERRAQLSVLGWDLTHVADMETKDDSEVDQNCDQCGIIQLHWYYHLKCMWTSKPCCQCKYHFVLMTEEGRGLCISPAIFSVKRHSLGEQFT